MAMVHANPRSGPFFTDGAKAVLRFMQVCAELADCFGVSGVVANKLILAFALSTTASSVVVVFFMETKLRE
jgi:cytochrome c oxidase subunit IV